MKYEDSRSKLTVVVASVETQKKAFHVAESHSMLEEKPIILNEWHHKNE